MSKLKRVFFCNVFGFMALSSTNLFAAEGVSPKAYQLFSIGDFPITNGMLFAWIISILLIVVTRKITGKPKLMPGKGQVVLESIIDSIYNITSPIVGKKAAKQAFPLIIGFFIYILIQNWSSLLPGVGTVGRYNEHGHFLYFFRPSNADLNSTLALAIISMFAWGYFSIKYSGVKNFIWHIFGNKANKKEVPYAIYLFLFFIFLGVGFVECISILFRLVSLSFRLYGNVFGGENLLDNVSNLTSWTKFFVPIPFYFLELLIGAIQAFVFTLLVSVYIGLTCNHDE